jgi:hypothetical protein
MIPPRRELAFMLANQFVLATVVESQEMVVVSATEALCGLYR